jgi:hypothetical protein
MPLNPPSEGASYDTSGDPDFDNLIKWCVWIASIVR